MYVIGTEVITYYKNSPISKENQYKLGQEVTIFDIDTRETLAKFVVGYTDEYIVTGIITWSKE